MAANLEGVRSGAIPPATIAPPKIEDLPQELLGRIFSFLRRKDLEAVASVSQGMRYHVQAIANSNEVSVIKNFIGFLIQKLNAETFPRQQEALSEVLRGVTFQNFVSLQALKGYILDVKTQLINVIKTLDTEVASHLRDTVTLPDFFEDIFELTAFERQIDLANLIVLVDQREAMFVVIIQALVQAGYIERAEQIWKSIVMELYQGSAGEMIVLALAKAGHIDRAEMVVKSIFGKDHQDGALVKITDVLIARGDIGRAEAVARSISLQVIQSTSLVKIANVLIARGAIDRAETVAESIPEIFYQSLAFQKISEALAELGDTDRAEKVAESISQGMHKNAAFLKLSKALVKAGAIEKAKTVARLIFQEKWQAEALLTISTALAASRRY